MENRQFVIRNTRIFIAVVMVLGMILLPFTSTRVAHAASGIYMGYVPEQRVLMVFAYTDNLTNPQLTFTLKNGKVITKPWPKVNATTYYMEVSAQELDCSPDFHVVLPLQPVNTNNVTSSGSDWFHITSSTGCTAIGLSGDTDLISLSTDSQIPSFLRITWKRLLFGDKTQDFSLYNGMILNPPFLAYGVVFTGNFYISTAFEYDPGGWYRIPKAPFALSVDGSAATGLDFKANYNAGSVNVTVATEPLAPYFLQMASSVTYRVDFTTNEDGTVHLTIPPGAKTLAIEPLPEVEIKTNFPVSPDGSLLIPKGSVCYIPIAVR